MCDLVFLITLYAARRAMAAACRCPLRQRRDFFPMAFLIPHAPGLWLTGVRCLISHAVFPIPHAPGWRLTGMRCLISHVAFLIPYARKRRLTGVSYFRVGGYWG